MRSAGDRYESLACAALQQAGLQLLARNFHCRQGEIDLVMREGDTVVFVEVRYRRHAGQGGALASVTASKRQRLIHAAQSWLAAHPRDASRPCRFDVVSYDGDADGSAMQWHRAAFEAY